MRKRFISQIAFLLLLVAASACSSFQAKSSRTWLVTLEVDQATDDVVNQTLSIIKTRLDRLGLANVKVERQANRILISLPEVPDRTRLKNVITTNGKLELMHVISPPSPVPVQTYKTKEDAMISLGNTLPTNRRVVIHSPGKGIEDNSVEDVTREQKNWVVVESPAVVTGNDLRSAEAFQLRPGRDDYYTILFSLKPSGAARLGAWTGANINQYLAVVLNDEVRSIAYIKSQIFDRGEITGRFTKQSAEDLANVLISGALPAPVKIISETAIK